MSFQPIHNADNQKPTLDIVVEQKPEETKPYQRESIIKQRMKKNYLKDDALGETEDDKEIFRRILKEAEEMNVHLANAKKREEERRQKVLKEAEEIVAKNIGGVATNSQQTDTENLLKERAFKVNEPRSVLDKEVKNSIENVVFFLSS